MKRALEFVLWGPDQRWRMTEEQRQDWIWFSRACIYAGAMKVIGIVLILVVLYR
jgi:hypothetical protein